MQFSRGTSVGPYVIEELLGAGAMGEVYRARDPRLRREVAIKVLASAKAPDPERLRRFEQEARAAAALTHPTILTIHDVGAHEGLPYLVSELLYGKTLREQLDAEPLKIERTIDLALQLVRGVAAAHAVKIVHRDIKPENLFLTRDGSLKILDFGLAKLKPDAFPAPDASTLGMSEPGRLQGTLAYMAPEQLRGEPVDERADLFAVGAVLYEMVTGRGPFNRASAAATVAAILNEPPPPFPEATPPGVERLILRCLEKEPGERYQTSGDLIAALEFALVEGHRPAESVATALRGVLSRQEKEALHYAEAAVEAYEYFLRGRQMLHRVNRPSGDVARRMFERAIELNPTDARALSLGANAMYDDGHPERALRWSARALQLYPDEQTVLINGACLRARLGKKEEAISILEHVFARGWGKRDWIEHDPDYDSLRDDPRFQALLHKLH